MKADTVGNVLMVMEVSDKPWVNGKKIRWTSEFGSGAAWLLLYLMNQCYVGHDWTPLLTIFVLHIVLMDVTGESATGRGRENPGIPHVGGSESG